MPGQSEPPAPACCCKCRDVKCVAGRDRRPLEPRPPGTPLSSILQPACLASGWSNTYVLSTPVGRALGWGWAELQQDSTVGVPAGWPGARISI